MWPLQKFLFTLPNYLTLLLAVVAIAGDHLTIYFKSQIAQAIFDNSTHFLIAGLSWVIISLKEQNKSYSPLQMVVEAAVCALIASLIDIDHFFAARSLNLKDATSLKGRPPLHCSTFPLMICSLILLMGHVLEMHILKHSSLIVLTAFASHHTRDATRRGYWFYPYGSTPPVPYVLYITFTCCIPYFIALVNNSMEYPQITSSNRLLI